MMQILDLGQSCLSENQFEAFKKMTLSFFADGKRSLLGIQKNRCGQSKETTQRIVNIRV
jgi:hypothetical protein